MIAKVIKQLNRLVDIGRPEALPARFGTKGNAPFPCLPDREGGFVGTLVIELDPELRVNSRSPACFPSLLESLAASL